MKKIYTILVMLAIFSLSMSAIAQTTYVIKDDGSGAFLFQVYVNDMPICAEMDIQSVIDYIKNDAAGADCIIQFVRNGDDEIANTGTANITFDGGASGEDWGVVTITGEITSECSIYDSGTIRIKDGVTVICNAIITNTAPSDANAILIYPDANLTITGGEISVTSTNGFTINNAGGTLNITGGTVEANTTLSSVAVFATNGKVNISGGTVKATGENDAAIYMGTKSKVTVSDNAVITGKKYVIVISNDGGPIVDELCLIINGGKVEGTLADTDATAILINEKCKIHINGGTVESKGFTIKNAYGIVTINGGTVKTSGVNGMGIFNAHANGTINIFGGYVEALSENATAILFNDGTLTISDGTVTGGSGISIQKGTTTITGGNIFSEGGHTIYNSGTLLISGGTFSSKNYYATFGNYHPGSATINGGMFISTGDCIVDNEADMFINSGIFFINGTADADFFFGDYDAPDGNLIVFVAWDKAAGNTTYEAGTTNDIFSNPAEKAKWDIQGGVGGISVKNDTNVGFIPIEGVTITGVGIKTMTNDGITVFPNPTTGKLTIDNGQLTINNVELFDVYGRMQKSRKAEEQKGELNIDISELSKGIYFLKINTENGIVTKKVIKN